jgi:hypothetical protein
LEGRRSLGIAPEASGFAPRLAKRRQPPSAAATNGGGEAAPRWMSAL